MYTARKTGNHHDQHNTTKNEKKKKQSHLTCVLLSMYMITDAQIMVAPTVYKTTCSVQSQIVCLQYDIQIIAYVCWIYSLICDDVCQHGQVIGR